MGRTIIWKKSSRGKRIQWKRECNEYFVGHWNFPKSGSIAAALFRHLSFFLGTPIGCHLDWLLAKLVMQIIHDLTCLVAEICGDFLRQVIGLLSSCTTEVLELVEQSILQGAKSLKDLIPIVMNSIIEAVVKKSVEDLKQLKE
ncbi:hypothetical protein LOK49_LG09G01104 [Camellia lanceoleosa]|uniref:Uncharacterized protein n=1 Tax=Camellia lanceoleosa TaxID=1840588 RepID=A0ACC0GI84_9ERIC|nr:hypothetical protein LOK49_LG09G01104 [Camellia lanceoleosa]